MLEPAGRPDLLIAVILFVLSLAAIAACSKSVIPGEQEEIPTQANDVPDPIRIAAIKFCKRLGRAQREAWFWDVEDQCWECTLSGLSRQAELDINPDGSFSELELVYDFTEVEKALPEVAEMIRNKCRNEPGVFIELSFRREEFLDDIPELKQAWSQSGVVLEFQCPNGRDFELDARGRFITRPVDDKKDLSSDKTTSR
jgi:hypothetical protein